MFLTKQERRIVIICLLIIALLLLLVFLGNREAQRLERANEYPCANYGYNCPTLEPEVWSPVETVWAATATPWAITPAANE